MKNIIDIYENSHLDFEIINKAAKNVLSLYRKVSWSVNNRANFMVCESKVRYGNNPEEAYVYLSTFAPENLKKDFESKVSNIFNSRIMLTFIYDATLRLKLYPEYGRIYYEIINTYYIQENRVTDEYCMKRIGLERTVYYQRKKEAIALVGAIIWGYSLPMVITEIRDGKDISELIEI